MRWPAPTERPWALHGKRKRHFSEFSSEAARSDGGGIPAAATPTHGEQAGPGPATPATGFHRLFLCFSFLGGGCGDPLLLLPGPLPCVLARPRGTDARGAGTDSGRTKAAHRGKPATAHRRPAAKLTGAKDQRKPCGAPFANVVETGGAGRGTGIATPEPTSNSERRCGGQFGGRVPARPPSRLRCRTALQGHSANGARTVAGGGDL